MDGNDLGQLAYLGILGAVLVGWFIAQNRNSLGRLTQQALVWGLIFVGVIAGAGLWSDMRDDILPRQSVLSSGIIEVPRSPDGHYYLTLDVNDVPVRFVVDTGASDLVLTQNDAERVGLQPERLVYSSQARTANGTVPIAPVRIKKVELGEMADLGVRASVNGGPMEDSLLGMSYLQRFTKIEIEGRRLLLHR